MASDIFNTGQTNVTNAYNKGASAISSFSPNDWQQTTQTGLNNIKTGQDATQNNYIQGFKDQILSQPTATDWYNKGNAQFNVQPLQDTSNTLNNAMLTTPQMNYDRTKGFNVDNNQVQQQTNQDLMRLSPLAIAAENNAKTAQTNASNYADRGMAQNAYELQPTQQQGTYLLDSYAREQSGFTTTQQAQLTALTEKLKQGVALSTEEMKDFAALAGQEATYQATLNTNKTTLANTVQGQKYQTVPAGNNLVNTFAQQILNPGTGKTRSF